MLKYALAIVLWIAVAAYIAGAASSARAYRRGLKISGLRIDVVDSSAHGHLVSSARVREWLRRGGIRTVGESACGVDLAGIEALVARNGFVDEVNAYVAYDGRLHIDISQRRPLLRLLTDGMNSYVTAGGYVFPAPPSSSLYVPVVTGSYRPPFPAAYAGTVRARIDAEKHRIDERLSLIHI